MDLPANPKTRLAVGGAAVALALGLGVAGMISLNHKGEPHAAPPASRAGLVIDPAPQDDRVDRRKVLRCFVAGRMVGELPLLECAKRNGVATDALDVGLDASGALAAAGQTGAQITPLPPPVAQPVQAVAAAAPSTEGPAGACWRYADGQWRQTPRELTLNACVQTLFAGRCEKPGGATYGRWGQQTLRLVAGKVEISSDNHSFRTLVEQRPGCVVPPLS